MVNHRGDRSGESQPGRCRMSSRACSRNAPVTSSRPSCGSRCKIRPARPTKITPKAASKLPVTVVGAAITRPSGTMPTPASSTAAHCARRSSPIRRAGSSRSMRVSFHAKMDTVAAERIAAVRRTRAVSVTLSHYTWPRMRAVDLIRRKRDGHVLEPDAIRAFVAGATEGSWPDYQLAAMLMAIVLRGMSPAESGELLAAMIASGATLDLGDLRGRAVDKHSTGGVGDKTSLIVAPLVAA